MLVHVRRPRDHDCTNGGLSKNHETLLVLESDAAVPTDPTMPVMVLRNSMRLGCSATSTEPHANGGVGTMAGGNYAVGNSQFNEAVENYRAPTSTARPEFTSFPNDALKGWCFFWQIDH
jgi:hypothetical protein